MKNNDILALKKEQWIRQKNSDYSSDYERFAKEQIKIRPKDVTRGMIPFKLNQAQKIIHDKIEIQLKETGKVRAIILKARQQGISTYCTGRVYWKTNYMPLSRSVVMAHDAATSDALFSMSKDIHSNMDSDFKPELSKSNAKEIIFVSRKENEKGEDIKELRGYRLYTAGSPEAGRGTTPTVAHLSEVAFWQYDDKILAGLFQGIPSVAGTEVILESTANGISGEFYRMWKTAEKGENEYVPIFIPWYITDEYRNELVPEKFQLSEDEVEYMESYSLDMPQMYWRRLKIGESGAVKFQQEYPATAEEAFVASGINIFDMGILNKVETQIPLRISRMDYQSGQFEQNVHGELFIYKYPKFEGKFIVSGDVALGVGQDSSVATVMDADRNICAIYRDNRIDPTKYGDLLFYLGRYFNNALLCVESNSIGVATLARLDQMNYPNIYYQTDIQKLSNEEGKRPGFRTTSATRPAIIGLLKNAIKERDIKINDATLLQELKEFVLRDNGKAEALPGCHDDHVISLAICLEVYRTHADKLTNTRIGFANQQTIVNNTEWI
jgi:hypothetical protein